MPTHVILQFEGLDQESVVCAEQIKTIDKCRLESYRGNIGSEWMSKIDEVIQVSVGLSEKKYKNDKSYTRRNEKEEPGLIARKETLYDGRQNDWQEWIQQQLYFFTNVKRHINNLKASRRDIDNQIEDILYSIEETDLNEIQGYKVYKLLRERREQRSKIDEELGKLEILIDCLDCEQMRRTYQGMFEKVRREGNGDKRQTVLRELFRYI